MLLPALPSLVALLALSGLAPRADESMWRPLVAYDEVRVELDASTVVGTGPYTVHLRWSFADRAASPQAWDAGVRYAIDVMEIDCRAGATRTWSSAAFTQSGDLVESASYDAESPTFARHRPETIGGQVAQRACATLAPAR